MPEHLVIFDARSLYDPAWHASRHRDDLIELGSGPAANGLAACMVANVLGQLTPRPTQLFVAWDGLRGKSDKPRGPKPDGFHADKEQFMAWWAAAAGGTHLTAPAGVESDDLCASAADQSVAEFTTVVSADKDLQQIVNVKVRLYNPSKKIYVKPEDVVARWGVAKPSHAALAMALIGDSGDGIKGVPGIGPKKSAQRLARHQGDSFLRIYDALEAEYGESFTSSFNQVLLQRDLVVGPPAPLRLAHAPGCLSPDGELAWRRLISRFSRPPLDDTIDLRGLCEDA